MLIPLQINPQLGVAWIFEIINQLRKKKPAIMLSNPRETIVRIVFLAPFTENLFSIIVMNIPEITMNGAFPLIITPKTDFTGFRKFRRCSFERILRMRKNRRAITVFEILLRTPR
jgi:hypothetical protein